MPSGTNVRVALVTSTNQPGLCPDDRLLLDALRAADFGADAVVWDDPAVDWARYAVTVIRSTWDYAESAKRRDDYVRWAHRVEDAGSCLINPAQVIEENTHKHYMLDLATEGLPIVPTILLERGTRPDLHSLVESHGWEGFVLKPAVGAGGERTVMGRHAEAAHLATAGALLARDLPHEDFLLQPFMESVLSEGEVSYMWIDGAFTHAVTKRARPGEFRVQDDHGGTVALAPMDARWLAAANDLVAPYVDDILYARVDLVAGADGEPLLMELELAEPELFFRFSHEATRRMVDAIGRATAR